MRRYYTVTLVAVFMIVSMLGLTTGRSLQNKALTTSSQAKPRAQSGITAVLNGDTITVSGIPLGTAYVFGMSDGYDQYRVEAGGKTTMTLLVKRDHCNPITHVRVGEEIIAVQESQTTLTAGSFDCSKVTTIPISECEALVNLYNSTNGDNWKDNTGWLENSNPCSWYEVHCYGSNITRISLRGNNLTGTIPGGINTLTKLESLDLGANNLTGQVPKEATSLVKIENLALDPQNCVPLSLRFWFKEIANKNATYCPEPTPDRANFNIFEIEPVQVNTEGVKKVNVVAIEIFPTSPDNPNCLHAESGIPCNHSVKDHEDEIPKRITALATFMNDASRYKNGKPYLDYQIVKRFRSYSRIPFGEQYINSGNKTVFRPDYKTILSKIDFCALNNQYNIDEVWIYTYHDDRVGGIEPIESYQIGKYGENRSNGGIHTEEYKAPNCGNYTIFNMAYDQATSGNIGHDVHIRLHHIEATVGYLDPELFWKNFSERGMNGNTEPKVHNFISGCGNTHYTPNWENKSTDNGIFDLSYVKKFSCINWHPDDSKKQYTEFDCNAWGCTQMGFFMMYMQNMPGYKNDISYNGKKMRNWWDYFIDYDNAYAQAQCLYDSCDGALSLPVASQINKNISMNSNCDSDTIIKTAGDTTWIITMGKDGVTTAIPAKGNPLKEKQLIQVDCEENEL